MLTEMELLSKVLGALCLALEQVPSRERKNNDLRKQINLNDAEEGNVALTFRIFFLTSFSIGSTKRKMEKSRTIVNMIPVFLTFKFKSTLEIDNIALKLYFSKLYRRENFLDCERNRMRLSVLKFVI